MPTTRRASAARPSSVTNGIGIDEERRAVRGARDETPDVGREDDGAGRDRAGKSRHERRPAGQKRREPPECRVEVDVLAAGWAEAPPAPRTPSRRQTRARRPATQIARNHAGFGTRAATCGGVNRMPPPMTLETMIAAALNGPSRRARDAGPVAVMEGADYIAPLRTHGPSSLFVSGQIGVVRDGMDNQARRGARARRRQIGTAITLTGLEIALRSSVANLYDTSGDRSVWASDAASRHG